ERMKLFELVTLNTVLFGAGKAAEGIQAFVNAPEAKGTLLGAWATDIGTLNDVILLRGFESLEDLLAERKRARLSDNPFCCKDLLRSWSADTYIPLEFTLPVTPGTYGRVYEIRSYVPKLDAHDREMAGSGAASRAVVAAHDRDVLARRPDALYADLALRIRERARGDPREDRRRRRVAAEGRPRLAHGEYDVDARGAAAVLAAAVGRSP